MNGRKKSKGKSYRYNGDLFEFDAARKEGHHAMGSKSHKSPPGSKGSKDTTGVDSGTGLDAQKTSLTLTVINQAFQQPFGSFFVLVHNKKATPLFTSGKPASEALSLLVHDGNPAALVAGYKGAPGVLSSTIFEIGSPYEGGRDPAVIKVTISEEFPLVTIATMALNTNDCFVSINGLKLTPGMTLDLPGLDAGVEENNELCTSIPGPACPADSGNVKSGNGEGFVHIHRGFFGVGGALSEAEYDWRNPMVRVLVN